MEEGLKPFVNDHKLNLFDYHEHGDFSMFKTENRMLFEVLSCANNKKKMIKILKTHQSCYGELDEDSTKAILGTIGMKSNLKTIAKRNEKNEEVYDVCKAFEDYKEEGRKEGELMAMKRALKNLMKNQKISCEEAMKMLGIPMRMKKNFESLI